MSNSATMPSLMTRILSAPRTVESRWATQIIVALPFPYSSRRVCWMMSSVFWSTELGKSKAKEGNSKGGWGEGEGLSIIYSSYL